MSLPFVVVLLVKNVGNTSLPTSSPRSETRSCSATLVTFPRSIPTVPDAEIDPVRVAVSVATAENRTADKPDTRSCSPCARPPVTRAKKRN